MEIYHENNLTEQSSKKISPYNLDTHIQSGVSEVIEQIEKSNEERVANMVDELTSLTEATIKKIERMNEAREAKVAESISNMTETAIKKIQKMDEEMEEKRDSFIWQERLVEWKKLY